jgi:hypothetical protein
MVLTGRVDVTGNGAADAVVHDLMEGSMLCFNFFLIAQKMANKWQF